MTHEQEINSGERFAFGENWARFLQVLNESRINEAADSLTEMLEFVDLHGRTFLDIGSGSGLFSLAARRMGAKVTSFDYDPQSVSCALELKRRYFNNDDDWQILSGSVLDTEFLSTLGKFDIVYSWGVLHHTGDMWTSLSNAAQCVEKNGTLFISLYNDQGGASKRWNRIKKIYNKLPAAAKTPFAGLVFLPIEIRMFLVHLVRRQPLKYFTNIRDYGENRGMSWWHDKIDWIGGYPFEVSKPEQVFEFYKSRGFELKKITTKAGGHGCNQFVFDFESEQVAHRQKVAVQKPAAAKET